MRIKDYVILPIKFINWNKISSIVIVCFLTFVFLLGHIIVNVGYNYDKYVKDTVDYNILARTFFVFTPEQMEGKTSNLEKAVKDMRKFSHVIHTYNDAYAALLTANIDEINKTDSNKTLNIKTVTSSFSPNISFGRKVENENEIICPRYLRVSNTATSTDDTIDMGAYFNQEITLSYDRFYWTNAYQPNIDKEFARKVKLVGIYDNVLSLETYNECYMLEDVVREMFLESESIYSKTFLETNIVYTDGTATEVIVDELENMDLVKNELTEAGYTVHGKGLNFDFDFINKVKILSLIGYFVLLVFIFIIFSVYINIFIKKQKKHIALYKTFGYEDRKISLLFIIQLFYYTMISFVLSLVICEVGVVIANNIISKNLEYFYIKFAISFGYELIFLAFLLGILYFISNMLNKKIYLYNVKELFNEVNL